MRRYEAQARKNGFNCIVGIDEVGRGPLAGPVLSCAANLKKYSFKNKIKDSKLLSEKERLSAFEELMESCVYGIGIVSETVIDEINILEATKVSMKLALENLPVKADFLLIDGITPIDSGLPSLTLIGGEQKSVSIAAASIIAKVIRDRIMCIYDKVFPGYGFSRHKGYSTRIHEKALKKMGPCLIHRATFHPVCDGLF